VTSKVDHVAHTRNEMLNVEHLAYLVHQHLFLLFGIFFLLGAGFFVATGYAYERYGHIIKRTEEPKRFWWNVVFYFLIGLFLIGLDLYKDSN
jgi:hypothetical protein